MFAPGLDAFGQLDYNVGGVVKSPPGEGLA
jgi:hypothetical protein